MKSIIKIKSLAIVFTIMLFGTLVCAQEKDTTQIKIGDKKILIIEEGEELEDGISELKRGVKDFEYKISNIEKKIVILKDSNKVYEEQLKTLTDDNKIDELEAKIEKNENEIEQNEKKIEAFNNGIEQIQEEIDELSEELDELSKEFEEDIEDEKDFDLKGIAKKSKKFKGHYAGFEFGLNNFLNSDFNMTLADADKFMELNTNKSWGYSLNFLQYSIPLFSKNMGFVTGMGFEWNNYNLKQNVDLVENNLTGRIEGKEISLDEFKYQKNTLNSVYFKIPLIFEFQIPVGKKDNKIFCGIGAEGAVKVASKTKKVYNVLGDRKKLKVKGDYQLSPLKYGLTARAGYEALELFANYSLQPLFEKEQGPELYPFTVGLRIDF